MLQYLRPISEIIFMLQYIIFILCILSYARSVHRLTDPLIPEIQTHWVDDKKIQRLRSYHLTYEALFPAFDEPHIMEHYLPDSAIPYRNNESHNCLGKTLADSIESVSFIIMKNPRDLLKYCDITVISDRNFEYRTGTGALIFRLNHYPFIVKMFRETPLSFVRPFKAGFDQKGIFVNGGGVNRYIAGFSRIKNLHKVQKLLETDTHYAHLVDFPRKWFYIPHFNRWFEVTASNVCCNATPVMQLPSIYCIVVDAIDKKEIFSLSNRKERHWAVAFSKATQEHIDPHIDNFMREKNTDKILVIDTEDFWVIGGLTCPLNFHTYAGYYWKLASKYINHMFFMGRKDHITLSQKTIISQN